MTFSTKAESVCEKETHKKIEGDFKLLQHFNNILVWRVSRTNAQHAICVMKTTTSTNTTTILPQLHLSIKVGI